MTRLLSFVAVILGMSSCRVAQSVTPLPIEGAQPNSFTQNVEFLWSGNDLAAIQKITITHPAPIRLIASPMTDELSLNLTLDVQSDHNDKLVQNYEKEVALHSNFASATPSVVMPPASCVETSNADGQVISVQGICVRELVISIPPQARVQFDLTFLGHLSLDNAQATLTTLHLPTNSAATLESSNWSGALSIFGGSSLSSIQVQNLKKLDFTWAGLTALLVAGEGFSMQAIHGPIHLELPSSDTSNVTLDGTPIQNFPYDRP